MSNIKTGLLGQGKPGYVLGAGQLIGTNTNDNAATGYVGEFVGSTIAEGSAVNLGSTGTATSITNISLTAGDWDIYGLASFASAASVLSSAECLISTTANSISGATIGDNWVTTSLPTLNISGDDYFLGGPNIRASISTTTIYYLTLRAGFTGGSVTGYGKIYARRRR